MGPTESTAATSLLGAIFGPTFLPILISVVVFILITLVFAFGNAYTVQVFKLVTRAVAEFLGKIPLITNVLEWLGFEDGLNGRGSILFSFLTAGALLNYFGVNIFGGIDWFDWIAAHQQLFVLLGTLIIAPVSNALYNHNPELFKDPAKSK